jgi:hypothetical protein
MKEEKNDYQKHKGYYSKYHKENFHKKRKEKGLRTKYKGEYCVRCLDGKVKSRWGLTIPTKLVKKHKLEKKIFKISISPKGKLILYTQLKGVYKNG